MRLCNWVSAYLQQRSQPSRNMRGGSSCSGSDERERALISCTGCDPGLPCTVPQGYCRAFTILFPILTSSVLPTTANGKWLCRVEGKSMLVLCQHTWEQWHVAPQLMVKDTNVLSIIPICMIIILKCDFYFHRHEEAALAGGSMTTYHSWVIRL